MRSVRGFHGTSSSIPGSRRRGEGRLCGWHPGGRRLGLHARPFGRTTRRVRPWVLGLVGWLVGRSVGRSVGWLVGWDATPVVNKKVGRWYQTDPSNCPRRVGGRGSSRKAPISVITSKDSTIVARDFSDGDRPRHHLAPASFL